MLPEDIGFVIGSGGSTINNIKCTANAHVQIYKPIRLGGTTNEKHPYFLIQATTQESIDIATQMIEKISKESYNRRHGVFHHSCPPKNRFVPPPKPSPPINTNYTDYSYKNQLNDFKFMIMPCECVINFPPFKYDIDHTIDKESLKPIIGTNCSRCNATYTHAKHVSSDVPITKLNELLEEPLVFTISDSESESESDSESDTDN